MGDDITYRGHRLEIRPSGDGWKVTIYRPGSAFHRNEAPPIYDATSYDEAIAEAKDIVDRLLSSD